MKIRIDDKIKMNSRDPKIIALLFNECINNRDITGLSNLMSEDHTFIDREGNIYKPKEKMVEAWKSFFEMYPHYKNTFNKIESRDNVVIITGHAFWSEENSFDPAIWVVIIEDDLVAEWHLYYDNEGIRNKLLIS